MPILGKTIVSILILSQIPRFTIPFYLKTQIKMQFFGIYLLGATGKWQLHFSDDPKNRNFAKTPDQLISILLIDQNWTIFLNRLSKNFESVMDKKGFVMCLLIVYCTYFVLKILGGSVWWLKKLTMQNDKYRKVIMKKCCFFSVL